MVFYKMVFSKKLICGIPFLWRKLITMSPKTSKVNALVKLIDLDLKNARNNF